MYIHTYLSYANIFRKSTVQSRHEPIHIHMFGCIVYILIYIVYNKHTVDIPAALHKTKLSTKHPV